DDAGRGDRRVRGADLGARTAGAGGGAGGGDDPGGGGGGRGVGHVRDGGRVRGDDGEAGAIAVRAGVGWSRDDRRSRRGGARLREGGPGVRGGAGEPEGRVLRGVHRAAGDRR